MSSGCGRTGVLASGRRTGSELRNDETGCLARYLAARGSIVSTPTGVPSRITSQGQQGQQRHRREWRNQRQRMASGQQRNERNWQPPQTAIDGSTAGLGCSPHTGRRDRSPPFRRPYAGTLAAAGGAGSLMHADCQNIPSANRPCAATTGGGIVECGIRDSRFATPKHSDTRRFSQPGTLRDRTFHARPGLDGGAAHLGRIGVVTAEREHVCPRCIVFPEGGYRYIKAVSNIPAAWP